MRHREPHLLLVGTLLRKVPGQYVDDRPDHSPRLLLGVAAAVVGKGVANGLDERFMLVQPCVQGVHNILCSPKVHEPRVVAGRLSSAASGTAPTLLPVTAPRWPIDTIVGKAVLVAGLLLMGVAAVGIRLYNAWWGYASVVVAVGLAFACRALFFRGYFGNKGDGEYE